MQRKRAALCPDVEVWADVMVKHATPPPGLTADQAGIDTVERGLADALIVSGTGTGSEPDLEEAATIRAAVGDVRIVIGSGATDSNLGRLLTVADSVIVGSSIKVGGVATNRPDPMRVETFIKRAAGDGLV